MKHLIILWALILPVFFATSLHAQRASVDFNVNMSYQVELGIFDPSADFVDLAGDFNGWGTQLTPLSDDDNDTVYSVSVDGFSAGQVIEFKFRYNGIWDGTEEFPGAGNNRVHTVTSGHDSLYFWYNDMISPHGPPSADFFAPSPVIMTGSIIPYQNSSSGNAQNWQWTFEGGYPETSVQKNPRVFYAGEGIFDVTLIAGNESESDTLLMNDYIIVNERDKSEIDWWNNTVFYEIFVRSFYDSDGDGIGDFNGLTQKLDYLNDGDPDTHDDLGITGIWLMPVNPSPSYHGYDVTNYRGINPDYGTMEDFLEFLDEAHERGIKVIVDYVMNHTSSQHPWFIDSKNNTGGKRNYYRWSDEDPGYGGPWGQTVWHYHSSGYYYGLFWSGMPDLNYREPQVKDSMFMIAGYWLDEIGVDGFRLDAIKYIYEDGTNLEDLPETFQFWKDFNAHTKQIAPGAFSVGEAWTNTGTVVKYVEDGGLDFCFEFDLASEVISAVNNGNASDLSNKISIVYSVYPHLQWGTFLTNHDMNRVMNVLGQDEEKNKLAASIYLTLPGIPFIYYGEEIGMLGEKPDENIRRPMQWSNSYQGGFTTGIPWNNLNSNYNTYNVETESENPGSIFNRYRKAIRVRMLKPALQTGDYLEALSSHSEVLSFIRATDEDTAVVVINTSDESLSDINIEMVASGLEGGYHTWWEMMSNQPETYLIDEDINLNIPLLESHQVKIWSFDEASGFNQNTVDTDLKLILNPNPASGNVSVVIRNASASHFNIKILDLYGREVKRFDEVNPGITFIMATSDLRKGIYLIIAESNGEKVCSKLIRL